MTSLGIMEGRLVPPEPGRFQAFPRARWADEFALAKLVPLDYIEWIYDAYGADINPLTNDTKTFEAMIQNSGVRVHSLCADYFMDFPLVRGSHDERTERVTTLKHLITTAGSVGIKRIVLPFVDSSSIENADDEAAAVDALVEVLPTAQESAVEIHLETSLPPTRFAALLERLPHRLIKVNYDSGNSASLGFDCYEEFAAYGPRVGSVHVKDRVLGGSTVPLGTGDCDFDALFECLKNQGYSGDITLQVARGEPGVEVTWARVNKAFVERYWSFGSM